LKTRNKSSSRQGKRPRDEKDLPSPTAAFVFFEDGATEEKEKK
jgi:hypothetical protein